jgi:hypothetical protein
MHCGLRQVQACKHLDTNSDPQVILDHLLTYHLERVSTNAESTQNHRPTSDSQSTHVVVNQQQPHRRQRHFQTQSQLRQTPVKNKKFKCVKCHYRANLCWRISKHFNTDHREVKFNRNTCIQVLDEDKAKRTLEAYERNHASDRILCKPYKCGKCEYRAAKKDNAYWHMRRIHRVEFYEARRLVKVLPVDEAEKTVGDYNKEFVGKSGLFCSKLLLKAKGKTGSAASNRDALTSKTQSSSLSLRTCCNKRRC